ncbi:lipopolysaccharide assembly protein LapB [Aliidiomarina shirensis]|uniref:Lipopolysaccharide assembly protein B n=1 Tax=Aliidiomarina shirensis TaxID=1048642 RepID=A0A432WXC8_9GAMM|nr:lipopolysaccharide assembly protein LapB [Aliidiomarina shirensis]RUO38406.1 lipopolysaccharide assembly protein LapB [Aliidiomarina shirensis]
MLELLFLLLPVAAAYGWFMGRNSVRAEQRKEQEEFSRNYVTGINLLLSEQSDKAVDLFIDMLDIDSETIETHWTLGKLFRRRGEVDRAIRIHQNLISRPSLSVEERQHAMYELGQDYLSAGIYDRAEQMFRELQQHTNYQSQSLQSLLALYEATHEWDKAIRIGLKISRKDKAVEVVIAQFYCELAEMQEEPAQTLKFYGKALKHDIHCVRARIALARWWIGQNKHNRAISYILPITEQQPDFIPEILPLLRECYEGMGDSEGLVALLHDIVLEHPCASAVVMLGDIIARRNDVEAAEQFMLAALQKSPTMKAFHKLIQFHVASADEGRARKSLMLLGSMVAEQLKQRSTHRCRHCGFASQTLYWHCPSCKTWGSIKPTRGLDGE